MSTLTLGLVEGFVVAKPQVPSPTQDVVTEGAAKNYKGVIYSLIH